MKVEARDISATLHSSGDNRTCKLRAERAQQVRGVQDGNW